MATTSGNGVSGFNAVNEPCIYIDYAPNKTVNTFSRVLNGLRILDIKASNTSNITEHPVESGIRIADNKVINPVKITITGICDNVRGGLKHSKLPGALDVITGYDFETSQEILSFAKKVYADIQAIYKDTFVDDYGYSSKDGIPMTFGIVSKGHVYHNMILSEVSEVNDAEHLLVIPCTLTFTELIFIGDRETMGYLDPADGITKMNGTLTKSNILSEAWGMVKAASSNTWAGIKGTFGY